MRFYPTQHQTDCGIDLHARTMSVCLVHQRGDIVLHRTMKTPPATFLQAIAPSRAGLVVAVACLFPWYGLADLGADERLPFVLGPALSRKALHGGTANNAPIDSHKIAALLRGGPLPQASVSPAQRRATRALLRRRRPLAHTRAERFAPVQHTTRQDTLPALGKKSADKATREGVAARCADPAVPKSSAGDRALLPSYDALLRDVDLPLVHTAQHHDAHPLSLRHPVPGLGHILRLVLRDDSHDIHCVPSVQDVVSSCRLGKCAKASGGKRVGTSGAKSGKAHLTWAFSAAAVLFLRANPAAQKSLARLEQTHDQGNAVTLLAQQLARAVSSMLHRPGACEREPFCQPAGRAAEEPEAERDTEGVTLSAALTHAACTASVNAPAPRGHETLRPAL